MRLCRLLFAGVVASALLVPGARAERPAEDQGLPAWFRIDAPAGWGTTSGDVLAESVAASSKLGAELTAGALHVTPAEMGTSLVVTWVVASAPTPGPEAAMRDEVDRLRSLGETLKAGPDEVEVGTWRESLAGGVMEVRMGWKNRHTGISSVSRTLMIRTASGLRQVSAECVRGPDGSDAALAACEAAMESLAIALPAAELLTIDAAALAAPQVASAPRPPTGTSTMPRLTLRDPGALGGERPVIAVEREDKRSYKTWLYAGGALLIAIAFYLTTRRDRSERDDDEEREGAGSDGDERDGSEDAEDKEKP